MIPFEWNQWVLSSPEIAFSSIIESPFMEPFLCMNITTIPLNINTNIRISSRFFYPLKVVPRKSVQFPKSKFKYRTYSFQPSNTIKVWSWFPELLLCIVAYPWTAMEWPERLLSSSLIIPLQNSYRFLIRSAHLFRNYLLVVLFIIVTIQNHHTHSQNRTIFVLYLYSV